MVEQSQPMGMLGTGFGIVSWSGGLPPVASLRDTATTTVRLIYSDDFLILRDCVGRRLR
jgi:hypothetical protein